MPDEPRHDKTLALPVQQQFNGICDRFEAAWKAGARPRIEAYLMESTGLPRAELLRELLLIELTYRFRLNERPVATEYDQRFPLDAALIRGVFRELRAPDGPLSDVILFDETVLHWGVGQNASPRAGDEAAVTGAAPLRFGRYVVTEKLGQGGFGVVYRGHDTELRRDVAIKVARRGRIATPADAEAYLAEARTVANLDHPNIVPVHDVGGTDQFPCYVVSKYIEGTDLATRLKEGRLPFAEAIELVATVAEALHHAHTQGVVHRDVKPGNILLDARGKPFVVDFGLALRVDDVGEGPKFAGTPSYMSPEQARGEGHRVDGRSDIFSLGVVLYELLTGRRPFKGESHAELLDQIRSQEPRPPRQIDDGISKELENVCLKALAKRSSERYTTAKDFAKELRKCQSAVLVEHHGVGPPKAYERLRDGPRAADSTAQAIPHAMSQPSGPSHLDPSGPPRSPSYSPMPPGRWLWRLAGWLAGGAHVATGAMVVSVFPLFWFFNGINPVLPVGYYFLFAVSMTLMAIAISGMGTLLWECGNTPSRYSRRRACCGTQRKARLPACDEPGGAVSHSTRAISSRRRR